MLSFAIPGTVLGVAYILAFNVPPVEITGTGLILVIAFVFRNMPVGVRSGIAGLSQIDKSLDEASTTLRAVPTCTSPASFTVPLAARSPSCGACQFQPTSRPSWKCAVNPPA